QAEIIPPSHLTGKNYNTYLGNFSGYKTSGSNNVFIGYNSGLRPSLFSIVGLGSGNVFIGANTSITTGTPINNRLMIDNSTTTTPLIWGDFKENQLKFNGKVGIGFGFGNFPTEAGQITANPIYTLNVENYNLFVYGGILTEEVRVILQEEWADYVFEEDYNLPTLQELEVFVKENKHLPNVPSAKEVKESGIELGEMAKIQQEKIEELTLYIIEQDKINKKQQVEIDELKKIVNSLLESKE